MPIYGYRCEECGHNFDALQKISDSSLTDCPACNAAALKKQVSAPNFRLSGSGWYETDFKSDKDKKKNLANSSNEDASKNSAGFSNADSKSADQSDKTAKTVDSGTKTTKTTDK